MKQFVWGALPYIAFTFLIVGTIVRYTVFERNWTTKSSQFLTKGNLPLAGPMFHLGLVMALGGHIIGVLIPKAATEAVGINEHLYHIVDGSFPLFLPLPCHLHGLCGNRSQRLGGRF